ncbi:hypothetical protein C8R45DRAFT_1094848 [Mycena sanguinolenta]|nr:hypothetical protein C8R45DRAFT_1094848 [Mycena sanguinolenta]
MDLLGHYPALEEGMKTFDEPLSFITLNAFQPNQYISYFGKVSLLNQGPESLLERLDVYQQQRANRANLPVEMKQTTPTTVKTWRIQPQTTEPKEISTETKAVAAPVVVGLAVGRAVF